MQPPSDAIIYNYFIGHSKGIRHTARHFRLSSSYVGSVISKYRKIHNLMIWHIIMIWTYYNIASNIYKKYLKVFKSI